MVWIPRLGQGLVVFVAGNDRPPMGILKQLRELGTIVRTGLTERPLGLRSGGADPVWPTGRGLERALMGKSR